ncbi:MAG TPA: polymer-forming cytoskeletal protein [Myxococcota bacterium]|nr:polymer-forming cytoskeletal protein [Myxococcota bacterium]HNZ03631.1 polymer-forming cytoskeletal protein [Myxococcota bacterium]HOD07013.1 polymer-forming cytoskeletal protein [Myxococcota bacterium]HPB49618.1 polymer-forming cytoskeletal protein [Myxococcota bacterium]HQP94914.1 polymer-forming cytoskeletal protein [Myxococcota bacterium]
MSETTVGTKTRINGRISGTDRLCVHGLVEGEVAMEGDLVVEADGRVEATVSARAVNIRGTVNGEVTGRDKVEIAPDGRMIGDVRTGRILISDGAVFKGRVEMDVREG